MKTTSPIRALVVEDEALVSDFIQKQLTNLGHKVAGCAFDGVEAVALTRQLRPDVVLMDLRMMDPQTGREDRLAGMRAARAIQELYPTPVILLTAYESRELVRQASDAGVGAYLVKPVRESELERAITVALARFGDLMALRRLNTNLHDRNEELDAYGHTVAHDLQSPLALIISFAEALAENDDIMSHEALCNHLREIAQSGRKMNDIIDELLLLASVRKIDDIELEPLDMGRIVTEAQRRLTSMIAERQAKITRPERWPAALGYRSWIEQVWVNYLSNAIKYGGRPPHVELGFDPYPASDHYPITTDHRPLIRFWVRDDGVGLTPEEQGRLFAPFTRLDQVRAKGNGLGLSIVRRIVEKLGGEVGAESEVGAGSTFWFTLPLSN
jgi:two-component system sensor histidine kinase/response regulator